MLLLLFFDLFELFFRKENRINKFVAKIKFDFRFLDIDPGMLRFQNTLTTNFYKTSLTLETDSYSYKKLSDKNSGFKVREKSGRVATLKKGIFFSDNSPKI